MLMSPEVSVVNTFSLEFRGGIMSGGGSTVVGGVAYIESKHHRSPAVNSEMVQTRGPHTPFPKVWAVCPQFLSWASLYYSFLPSSQGWPQPLVEFCILWGQSLHRPTLHSEPESLGWPEAFLFGIWYSLFSTDCWLRSKNLQTRTGEGVSQEITQRCGSALLACCAAGVKGPPTAVGRLWQSDACPLHFISSPPPSTEWWLAPWGRSWGWAFLFNF